MMSKSSSLASNCGLPVVVPQRGPAFDAINDFAFQNLSSVGADRIMIGAMILAHLGHPGQIVMLLGWAKWVSSQGCLLRGGSRPKRYTEDLAWVRERIIWRLRKAGVEAWL